MLLLQEHNGDEMGEISRGNGESRLRIEIEGGKESNKKERHA